MIMYLHCISHDHAQLVYDCFSMCLSQTSSKHKNEVIKILSTLGNQVTSTTAAGAGGVATKVNGNGNGRNQYAAYEESSPSELSQQERGTIDREVQNDSDIAIGVGNREKRVRKLPLLSDTVAKGDDMQSATSAYPVDIERNKELAKSALETGARARSGSGHMIRRFSESSISSLPRSPEESDVSVQVRDGEETAGDDTQIVPTCAENVAPPKLPPRGSTTDDLDIRKFQKSKSLHNPVPKPKKKMVKALTVRPIPSKPSAALQRKLEEKEMKEKEEQQKREKLKLNNCESSNERDGDTEDGRDEGEEAEEVVTSCKKSEPTPPASRGNTPGHRKRLPVRGRGRREGVLVPVV